MRRQVVIKLESACVENRISVWTDTDSITRTSVIFKLHNIQDLVDVAGAVAIILISRPVIRSHFCRRLAGIELVTGDQRGIGRICGVSQCDEPFRVIADLFFEKHVSNNMIISRQFHWWQICEHYWTHIYRTVDLQFERNTCTGTIKTLYIIGGKI